MAAHDVRSSIPLTAMTDPSQFPAYVFQEYPKGMNMKADQKYVDDWMERSKQIDDNSGKPYWPGGRPRVGSIVPILDDLYHPMFVQDEVEEQEFRAAHPEAVTIVSVDTEMQQLRASNERLQALVDAKNDPGSAEDEFEKRLAALQAENDRLKGQQAAKSVDQDVEKDDGKQPTAEKPKNGLPPRLK